ncbi:MAG TPA: DNA-formamidopyrimidine glycosylase, partial [Elusimicrobia bacterium]|nr:DNA-formamidopyrimidine glycosylase [Elusimicrobiota bacterium]
NNKSLVFHLKLTGQLIYGTPDKKSRIIFCFDNGKCLNFLDQRRFAELRLTNEWNKEKGIIDMGPEPFDKSFNLEKFRCMLGSKKTKIKPLLMDQNFLAGVGNIYAQEVLFRVGIHPERPVNKLRTQEVENLYSAIKGVLLEAIKYRGSSVDAYVDTQGKKGGMEQRLKVYGRAGQSCQNCGTLLKEMKLAGRGTTYCPKCQK